MTVGDMNFIRELFQQDVPEVANGTIQLKAIARRPGILTKVAVSSIDPNVDPVGLCVGPRGVRMKSIVTRLNGGQGLTERLDLFRWHESPERLIAAALSPAQVLNVKVALVGGSATVEVTNDTFERAIGENGVHQRLVEEICGRCLSIVKSGPDSTTEREPRP
jgi:N utilization substance protein A